MATLPKASTPLVQPNSLMTPEWYRLFQQAFGEVTNLTGATGSANTMPGNNTGSAAADIRLTPAQIKALLAITAADVSGLAAVATSGNYASLTGTQPDVFSGEIEVAANQFYNIVLRPNFAGTLTTLSTYCQSGSCTMGVTINGGAVSGLSNSVTTAGISTSTASGSASFSATSYIGLSITSNSSARSVAFAVGFNRTVP